MRESFLCLSVERESQFLTLALLILRLMIQTLAYVKLLIITLIWNKEQQQQNYLENWVMTSCFLENKNAAIINEGQSDINTLQIQELREENNSLCRSCRKMVIL